MVTHINSLQNREIATSPVSRSQARTAVTQPFSSLLGSLATGKPGKRTPATTIQQATPAQAAAPASTTPAPVTSSDGTSLANLMAAASYAGIPYADLGQSLTSNGAYNPNWQQDMANELEARLQSVAQGGASNQIYDPNPANDSVAIDKTNTRQFTSSAAEIQGLLNNMWAAVHAGSVSGYHTALQQVDQWYQNNGQQNYYTGLSDAQVAAFNPANGAPMSTMPNANSAVAAAELAAISGQSTLNVNLAAIAAQA